MLDHVLDLAAHGYECFPLAGKVPAIAGGRGCLDATNDPDQLGAWWTVRPTANVGIRVRVGELVIDTDPRHGGDVSLAALEAEHGPLPATRTAESGRGDGGRHFHFLAPEGPVSSTRLPAGIDLKGRGGYVVAPPSIHPDSRQPYRWLDRRAPAELPNWLAELLRPPAPKVYDRPVQLRPGQSDRRLEALVQFVLDAGEGNRNSVLFWASCRGHEMVLEGIVDVATIRRALELAGEAVGLPTAEVESTIGSAFAPGRVSA